MSVSLRHYCRGYDLVSMRTGTGEDRVYHFDHQGTTQCLTDSLTGAITDRFVSDAWGIKVRRVGASINRQWYIGNQGYVRSIDGSTDYVRARHLAVSTGTWLSTDRLLDRLRFPKYIYVDAQPTNAVDPSGWITVTPEPCDTSTEFVPQCGRVYCRITFKAHPMDNGWIIQHVRVMPDVKKCKDVLVKKKFGCRFIMVPDSVCGTEPRATAAGNGPIDFWEAWEVKGGTIYAGFASSNNVAPEDTFGIENEPASCGSITKSGTLYWMPGYQIPANGSGWSMHGSEGHFPNAGNAITRTTTPPGLNNAHTLTHVLTSSWDCCPFNDKDKRLTTYFSTPQNEVVI